MQPSSRDQAAFPSPGTPTSQAAEPRAVSRFGADDFADGGLANLSFQFAAAEDDEGVRPREELQARKPAKDRVCERDPSYRTEICARWLTYGVCEFGSECSFAHNEGELRIRARDSMCASLCFLRFEPSLGRSLCVKECVPHQA